MAGRYPFVAPCPACFDYPELRHRWLRGWRIECRCGACGPFRGDGRGAAAAWENLTKFRAVRATRPEPDLEQVIREAQDRLRIP